jgi:hypothetical protein
VKTTPEQKHLGSWPKDGIGAILRTAKAWTENDDAAVRKLFGDGFSDHGIAVRIGRTPAAVGSRRIKLGLLRRSHG